MVYVQIVCLSSGGVHNLVPPDSLRGKALVHFEVSEMTHFGPSCTGGTPYPTKMIWDDPPGVTLGGCHNLARVGVVTTLNKTIHPMRHCSVI